MRLVVVRAAGLSVVGLFLLVALRELLAALAVGGYPGAGSLLVLHGAGVIGVAATWFVLRPASVAVALVGAVSTGVVLAVAGADRFPLALVTSAGYLLTGVLGLGVGRRPQRAPLSPAARTRP